MKNKFYVKPETAKGVLIAYGVYDCVGGMESEHHRFPVGDTRTAEFALHLAKSCRDDMNNPPSTN